MLNMNSDIIFPQIDKKDWWVGNPYDIPLLDINADDTPLLIMQDALTPAQCQILIDCYERNYETLAEHTGVEFWDGRYIQFHDLMNHEIDAARIMQQIRHTANLHIIREFAINEPVYSDSAQLVGWTKGIAMRPHADNIKSNGEPNGTPHRSYSSILYLNDDYEGGHTYFPGLGVRVAPKQGTLVMFGAGYEYVHGVSEIISGKRYMYSGWFSADIDWLDDASLEII